MTTTGRPGPVVAGVDYSSASGTAVSYAAWEAQRRSVGLRLVHGFIPGQVGPPDSSDADRLDEAAAEVRSGHPGLAVSTRAVSGSGGMALVSESASASLVVVGSRGSGGFDGLLLGSVATQVSQHARCPVLVVRPAPADAGVPGEGRVLVAVDGSAPSTDALCFGFDEAAARGVPLVAVHVWSVPAVSARSFGTVWSKNPTSARAQLEDAASQVLDAALVGWPQKYPQVQIDRRSVHGDEPARTLLGVADEVAANLIVAGSRPRNMLSGKVLGSVSQALVAHAHASVAVIDSERLD